MYLFKYLIIMMSISSCLTLKTKLKQEQSIFISFFGINLITYILGLVNLLKYSIGIIFLISTITLIWSIIIIIKDKSKIKEIITLPVCIYLILLFFIYLFIQNISFSEYDEFMFWGPNLKSMVYKNVLWANPLIDGIHLTYQPFSAINGYIFCKFNGFYSETSAYFGIITFLITLILPIFKDEKNNAKSFGKVLLVYLLLYITIIYLRFKLTNIMIDLLLGVNFIVSFYLVRSKDEKIYYLLIGLSLISLTLLKTNGILLAGIVLMYMFIKDIIINKKRTKNDVVLVFIIILGIIVSFLSWELYCRLHGTVIDERHDKHNLENIDISEFINAVALQENKCSERNYKLVKDFYIKLCFESASNMLKMSPMFIVFMVNIIGILICLKRKDSKILCGYIVLDLGFIGYLLSVILIYMFVFVEYQGTVLMDMYRYINLYLIGYIFFTIFILSERNEYHFYMIGILLLIILININFSDILNYHINIITSKAIDERKFIESIYIKNRIESDSKIFIIDTRKNGGISFMKLRYLLSPIQTNLLYEWDITTTEPSIYYQTKIPVEELEKILISDYDYVYLYNINERFKKEYSQLFENFDSGIANGYLYKIIEINDKVRLTLVN